MAKRKIEEFFSVAAETIVKDRVLSFDLYIFLPINGRVIHYRNAGDVIETLPQIIKNFYVRKDQEEAYLNYLSGKPADAPIVDLAAEPPPAQKRTEGGGPAETKPPAELTTEPLTVEPPPKQPRPPEDDADLGKPFVPERPAEAVMSDLLKDGPQKDKAMKEAKQLVEKILVGPPTTDPTLTEMITNPATEHATTVAVYTTLFAMGLKRNEQRLLQDLIIACLIHDIGLTQLPPSLLLIPESKRTHEEKTAFRKHVELGMDLLLEQEYVPSPRVIQLISQHHEKFDGSGYPAKLESFKIDELAQIICFADLVDTICRGRFDGVTRSLPEALAVVAEIERQTTFPQYFNPDVFKRIRAWLVAGSGEDHMAAATTAVEETRKRMLKTG